MGIANVSRSDEKPARDTGRASSGVVVRHRSKGHKAFDVQTFLETSGIARKIVEYRRGQAVFRQGDPCESVLYVQQGRVKISVLSKAGRQAVIAMLGPGEFFGEGGLAGQPVRMASATAVSAATILAVDQDEMVRLLHNENAMSDRLIAHLLTRTIRIEEDLVDQLFSSSEKRLARKLLVLAQYGRHHDKQRTIPPISQETLAEWVGTTRSRVNVFMKRFERLGFIDQKNGLKVNDALVTVVLHD